MVWGSSVCSLGIVLLLLVTSCSPQLPADVDSSSPSIPTIANSSTLEATATTSSARSDSAPAATPFTPSNVSPTPMASKRNGRIVLGYYVTYDTTSWASFQARADAIDYVVLQTISPDACGYIASESDLTLLEFAHSRGVRVLPSVFTSSRWLNHRLLADEAASSNFVQQLTSYVVEDGYDGLDVDLEDIEPTDRKALTDLIAKLSELLHKKGKLLTMAVPAKASDVTVGWAGAYDYAALAPYVDLFTIMTYAYTISSSAPGSTAPIEWVDKVMGFATSQIPPRKVLLGVPFWGYDWNVTMGGLARALRYPQAAELAAKYGAAITLDPSTKSAKMTYAAVAGDQLPADQRPPALDHKTKSRTRPPCPAQPVPPTPGPTKPPKPTPPPGSIQEHVVWLEDAASTAQRLNLAEKHGTGGIGAWRLGQEDPGVWPLLEAWR